MKNEKYIYKLIEDEYLGKLNESEKSELRHWKNQSEENQNHYFELQKVIKYSARFKQMNKINIPKDLAAVKSRMKKKSTVKRLYANFQKIAAILILPILIYSAYVSYSFLNDGNGITKVTETAFGVRTQITLSDGTQVWLNSDSKLSYPEDFDGDFRKVELIGEAYFHVKSDKHHPFYVDLGDFMVKATGTKFNISNYSDWGESITYLESGKVSLVEFQGKKEVKHYELQQDQQIIVNVPEKKLSIKKAEREKHLSWISGKLHFKNDPMIELTKKLGRWYNVDFVIQDDEIYEYLFTATFENESLQEALNLLSYSSSINFKIVPGKQNTDSTFSKRKVIITKK